MNKIEEEFLEKTRKILATQIAGMILSNPEEIEEKEDWVAGVSYMLAIIEENTDITRGWMFGMLDTLEGLLEATSEE